MRTNAIINGYSVPADVFILILFVALMLVPIFSEFEIFGFKFKTELEEFKTQVSIKLGEIKNEIKLSQNQVQNFNATFQGFGPPPPDNKINELENSLNKILNHLTNQNQNQNLNFITQMDVPNDNLMLFKVRFNLENQLRRIWEQRFKDDDYENKRFQPIHLVIKELLKYEILNSELYEVLREIISICNYGIHGNKISEKQINFVNNNAGNIINYLNDLY